MSSSDEQSTSIQVVTWPPLWVYWPAYVALARAEKELTARGVHFSLVQPEAPITDARIREKFQRLADQGQSVIAICEPRDEKLSRRVVRRLPLIWRQPHWVLWKHQEGEPQRTGFIWAYPPETTSGDFVIQVANNINVLKVHDGKFQHLPPEFEDERTRIKNLALDDSVVSFTPWHAVLWAEWQAGKQGATNDAFASVLLSGPVRDVTAIQVPDEGKHAGNDQSLSDCIAKHLKIVLDELSATQGEDQGITAFLNRRDNLELTKAFLSRQGAEPQWLEPTFLVTALSEYVKLGCYFPYRTLDSAISAEIQKRVGDVLQGLQQRALDEIQVAMANFLGASADWQHLSFAERTSVWNLANSSDRRGLWSYLNHRGRDPRTSHEIIHAISSRTHEDLPPLPVLWLFEKFPTECVLGARNNDGRTELCLRVSKQEGVMSPRPEVEALPSRCTFCTLVGSPVALLRVAAETLASGLKVDVAYRSAAQSEITRHVPCPIVFEDVAAVIDLFQKEQRPSSHKCPAEIVCYNEYATGEGQTGGHILFGIWWDGDTRPYSGTNNTARKLGAWQSEQQEQKRGVPWVGTWKELDDGDVEVRAAQERPEDLPIHSEIKRSPLWELALNDFKKSRFLFAYIAVFEIPAATHK